MKKLFYLVVLISSTFSLLGCSGSKIQYDKNDAEYVGRELRFNVPMVYVSTKGFEKHFSKEVSKYGNELYSAREYEEFFVRNFEIEFNSKEVPLGMRFKIVKSFFDIPTGILSAGFNSTIWYFVIEDENKITSVVMTSSLNRTSDFEF